MGRTTNRIETVIEERRWFYYDETNESDVEYVRNVFGGNESEYKGESFDEVCSGLLQIAHDNYIEASFDELNDLHKDLPPEQIRKLRLSFAPKICCVPKVAEDLFLYPCFINNMAVMIIDQYLSECEVNTKEDIIVYTSQISKICKEYFADKITVASLYEEDIRSSIEKIALGKTKSKGTPFFLLFCVIIEKTYKEIYENCNNQKEKINELAFEIGILDNEELQKIFNIPYLERTGKWTDEKSFGFAKLYETVSDVAKGKCYSTLEEVIEARHCLYDAYFIIMDMLQKAGCNEIVSASDWELKEDIYQYLYNALACNRGIRLKQNFLANNWLFEDYYKSMVDDKADKRLRLNIRKQLVQSCELLLPKSEMEKLKGSDEKVNVDKLMTYICKKYNEAVATLGDKSFCLQKQNNMEAPKNKPYKCLFALMSVIFMEDAELYNYVAAYIKDCYENRKTRKTEKIADDIFMVASSLREVQKKYIDLIYDYIIAVYFELHIDELDYIMELAFDSWWDILISPEIFREPNIICDEPKMQIFERVNYPSKAEWKTAIRRLSKKYENFDIRDGSDYVLKWLDS